MRSFGFAAAFFCALSWVNISYAGNVCGNGQCEAGEDTCNCPEDCPNDPFVCDPCDCGNHGGDPSVCFCDGLCVGFGDCCGNSCEACGYCPPVCGDGTCESGEDSCNCPEDCPDDPSSCSPCECDFNGNVAGNGPPGVCACDAGCESRGDCCENQCFVCGDCIPIGACCTEINPDFQVAGGFESCIVTSEVNCWKGIGGNYLGDGTTCDDNPCATGACCHQSAGGVAGPNGLVFCNEFSASFCQDIGGTYLGDDTECNTNSCNADQRLSTVKKGSLLVFPGIELRWAASAVAGGGGDPVLTQDTILTLVNDFTRDVKVKLYFVNGDAPTAAIYADDLETILVERAHRGWNQVDCAIDLTANESTYLVMSNGVGGCQRFSILDPGTPPGRPNVDPEGGRILRGFVIAFAVDADQNEISYNHLSGHADIIDYELRSAWEYQAYAFQAINPSTGTWTDGTPGELSLDGVEYDYAFNTLLFDFFAVGSTAYSTDDVTVMLDTDLTLMPMDIDLRQDSCGPVTTKAHFDIWNANEDFRSGTTRCITCWDQTLLSAYGVDNNFILADLGTDKGKARIDGVESFECDNLFVPPTLDDAILQWLLQNDRVCEMDFNVAGGSPQPIDCCSYTINDSQSSALLGVAAKILSFSGAATGKTWAGMNLVGAGQQRGQILFDVPAPPETATERDSTQRKNSSLRSTIGESRSK